MFDFQLCFSFLLLCSYSVRYSIADENSVEVATPANASRKLRSDMCGHVEVTKIVQNFFSSIFSNFPDMKPACVCIQPCAGFAAYCYPNRCYKGIFLKSTTKKFTTEATRKPLPSWYNHIMSEYFISQDQHLKSLRPLQILTSEKLKNRFNYLFRKKLLPKPATNFNEYERKIHASSSSEETFLDPIKSVFSDDNNVGYMKRNTDNNNTVNNLFNISALTEVNESLELDSNDRTVHLRCHQVSTNQTKALEEFDNSTTTKVLINDTIEKNKFNITDSSINSPGKEDCNINSTENYSKPQFIPVLFENFERFINEKLLGNLPVPRKSISNNSDLRDTFEVNTSLKPSNFNKTAPVHTSSENKTEACKNISEINKNISISEPGINLEISNVTLGKQNIKTNSSSATKRDTPLPVDVGGKGKHFDFRSILLNKPKKQRRDETKSKNCKNGLNRFICRKNINGLP